MRPFLLPLFLALGQLALVGAVRVKQWRAQQWKNCAPQLYPMPTPCFGPFRLDAAEDKPFGPNADGQGSLIGFSIAQRNRTREDSTIYGERRAYPPQAYVVDLPTWPRQYEVGDYKVGGYESGEAGTDLMPSPYKRSADILRVRPETR